MKEPVQESQTVDVEMNEPESLFFDKFLFELNKKTIVVGAGSLKEFPHFETRLG